MAGAADRPFLIREARPEDELDIRALLDETVGTSLDAGIHNLVSIRQNVHENVDMWLAGEGNILHLVAEQDGELSGALLIKDYRVLCSLFVRPQHQRQGVGSALVRIAIERCEAIDSWESLRLFANNDAVAFYEALGFEIKVLTKPAPPGSTAMCLYKEPRT